MVVLGEQRYDARRGVRGEARAHGAVNRHETRAHDEGSCGKLGHGNVRSQLKPRRVEALLGVEVTSISAGWDHTLCITDSGLLYGWGANEAVSSEPATRSTGPPHRA